MAKKKYHEIEHEGKHPLGEGWGPGVIDDKSPAAVGIEWERQPGPRNLRNKKIQYHDQYSNDLHSMIDTEMQEIYRFLKQMRDELEDVSLQTTKDTEWAAPILLNAGYRVISRIQQIRYKTMVLTKNYAKEQHFKLPSKLDWKNLCYDGNEKALETRIINIYKQYALQLRTEKAVRPDTLMYSLFGLMFRIANTESMYLSNHILALVDLGQAQFGEYVSGENCVSNDPGSICDQYCDGIHSLATLHRNIPPFHPNCNCFAVYYTIDELNDSNKEEKEE